MRALIRRAVDREYLQPTAKQKLTAVKRLLGQDIDFGAWERAKKDISQEIIKERKGKC